MSLYLGYYELKTLSPHAVWVLVVVLQHVLRYYSSHLLLFIIFSGSAAQRRLWPPVALQPSAGYGLLWLCSPARATASSFTRFHDHTQRRTTAGRTLPDEWSAHRRPLPDNTQQTNTHAPVGFEPSIAGGERSKTYAIDRAATWTGITPHVVSQITNYMNFLRKGLYNSRPAYSLLRRVLSSCKDLTTRIRIIFEDRMVRILPLLFWTPKTHYRIHRNPQWLLPWTVFVYFRPSSYFLTFFCLFSSHLWAQLLFPSASLINVLYVCHIIAMHATCMSLISSSLI
jgi:hypothetical protein